MQERRMRGVGGERAAGGRWGRKLRAANVEQGAGRAEGEARAEVMQGQRHGEAGGQGEARTRAGGEGSVRFNCI